MIRGGTTTCVNHLVAETSAGEEEAILQPVAASGMRQFFAKAVRPGDVKDDFESARSCFETWDGAADGRIRVGLVLEATSHWVAAGQTTEEMLIGGHGLAAELNTFITAHIAGGTMSREDGYLKYVLETGRTDIEFLHRLGILDRRWILAHTINTRERDLALIADSGATVSHTPSSEAARGGGVTPVREMLRRGIRVALGTDGPMVDHTNDMLEQLKWTHWFVASPRGRRAATRACSRHHTPRQRRKGQESMATALPAALIPCCFRKSAHVSGNGRFELVRASAVR
jgi:5-methylthioadenosine/S-adenosylhomocysteine deaminase